MLIFFLHIVLRNSLDPDPDSGSSGSGSRFLEMAFVWQQPEDEFSRLDPEPKVLLSSGSRLRILLL